MGMATLLPALDVFAGLAVAAQGGRRDEYRPLQSRLSKSADPLAVALALRRAAGTDELYAADLDALRDGEPQWPIWETLAKAGVRLWLDAATAAPAAAARLLALGAENVIIALESLPSAQALSNLAESLDPNRLVFSLDLKEGRPVCGPPEWRSLGPGAIAASAWAIGFRRLIILDLAAVGGTAGPATLELCEKLRRVLPRAELISGGGVRGPADVAAFEKVGVGRVLVGTALHAGKAL